MNLRDYLYEGNDDRKSLFSRAKALALSTAKSLGRSTKSISKSSSASELEVAVSGWQYSKEPKAKKAHSSIMSTLSKDSKPEDETKNSKDTKSDETNQVQSSDEKQSIETEIKKDVKNLAPQDAKEYELAVKQKENDMQRISKDIIDNEKRVKESISSLSKFIENLIKIFAPDANISLGDTSDVDNRIEMMNNINDSIDSMEEYRKSVSDDIKTKIEAQDTILKDKEKELSHKNCPEVDRLENKRKKDISDRISKEVRNDPELRTAYEEYKYYLNNIESLTPEERKEMDSYKNGAIGKLIDKINSETPALTKEQKDNLNAKWRELELKRVRDKVQAYKSKFESDLNTMLTGFDSINKDIVKKFKACKKKLEKGNISPRDLESLKSASEAYKEELENYRKKTETEQSKREEQHQEELEREDENE